MNEQHEGREQFAKAVIGLVGMYRSQEELSIYEMLRRIGYPTQRTSLTVDTIRMVLASEPERLKEWLAYSEDKRVDAGWYLRRSDGGDFEVGNLCRDGSVSERRNYQDLEDACGDFILHELDEIAFGSK